MSDVVLDSAAILALILEEPGADVVADAMGSGAVMSSVNYAEVITRLIDLGWTSSLMEITLTALEFDVAVHTTALAWRTGLLRTQTKQFGLSLGDRSCLALALERRLPVLTGDRNWARVDVGVEVRLCR